MEENNNNNNHPLKQKEVVIDVHTDDSSDDDVVDVDVDDDDVKTHLLSPNSSRTITRLLSKPSVGGLFGFIEQSNTRPQSTTQHTLHISIQQNNLGAAEGEGSHSQQEHFPLLDHQQQKPINSKKARKPPRPPKGPSLTASDLKLVREITEFTMKKRARIERIKTLKKMKAAAKSSSQQSSSPLNSTLTAIIVTAVFCFVIILQGFCSRTTSTVDFQGSPGPSSEPEGLISVQLYNISPNVRADQSWESSPRAAQHRFLLQVSGSRHKRNKQQ